MVRGFEIWLTSGMKISQPPIRYYSRSTDHSQTPQSIQPEEIIHAYFTVYNGTMNILLDSVCCFELHRGRAHGDSCFHNRALISQLSLIPRGPTSTGLWERPSLPPTSVPYAELFSAFSQRLYKFLAAFSSLSYISRHSGQVILRMASVMFRFIYPQFEHI